MTISTAHLTTRVSSAYARLGHESRQQRQERRALNNAAFHQQEAAKQAKPRIVRQELPSQPLQAIPFDVFLRTAPVVEIVAMELLPLTSFDKRAMVEGRL